MFPRRRTSRPAFGFPARPRCSRRSRAGRATAFDLDAAAILAALRRREGLGSTGIGDGIALPHARLDAVARPLGLLARLRGPIAFDAVDERPVDLAFLLLLPAAAPDEALNAIASVARRLRDPEAAEALRRARDAAGLYAAICGPKMARPPA
ncbi:MAG TPA: PTS sugar transporter subunit IIA [Methylobacterium sp.]|nr:PTS sugar transporter subunit IIA [Methylobacterium sp.]